MANLNVSLIVKYVSRMSAGVRRDAAALGGLVTGQKAVGAASTAAAAATNRVVVAANRAATAQTGEARAAGAAAAATTRVASAAARSASAQAMAAKGAAIAAQGVGVYSMASTLAAQTTAGLTAAQAAGAATAGVTGLAQETLGRATETAGRRAEDGARRFTTLERAQMRGAAAMRLMKSRAGELEHQLTNLAKVAIVTEGLSRAGHFLAHPITHSVSEAASFAGGMTGFGITAELSDAQMAPIRKAILAASRTYALAPEQALEAFAYTRRSGVFKQPAQIIAAGGEAARFQKLAERMGSPVTGQEAAGGAASAVREYGFAANPAGLRKYFAMIDAAEKVGGGVPVNDLLQYSRSSGGFMKSFGSDNPGGLADVLAAHQVSMYLAHTGAQAGINVQDLLANIGHHQTRLRFKKVGIDLPAVLQAGWEHGQSALVTFAKLAMWKTEGLVGPARAEAMGKLMYQQQAGQSLMALAQNMDKFKAYRAQIVGPGVVGQYDKDVNRVIRDPKTTLERWTVAKQRLAISIGTLLLPITERFANVLERAVDLVTRFSDKGGILGKVALIGVSGIAGLALAAAGLGHVLVGVLGPLYIMRTLFKDILPLGAVMGKARAVGWAARAGLLVERGPRRAATVTRLARRNVWRGALAGADVVMAAPRAIVQGVRSAGRAVVRAPGAAIAGVRAMAARASGSVLGLMATVRGFSMAGLITGLRAGAAGLLAFVTSGRVAVVGMRFLTVAIRGVLAASGIGLVILAATLLVTHWRGVMTFFQGFGRGFMRAVRPVAVAMRPVMAALRPLAPVLRPVIDIIRQVGRLIGAVFSPKQGEDWSAWGEKVGGAIGGVVTWIARLIGWIVKAATATTQLFAKYGGAAGAVAALMTGQPALAALSLAASAPPPQHILKPGVNAPPAKPPPAAAAKGAPGAKAQPTIGKVDQHFHITTPQPDPKKLAAELQRQAEAGQRRAAHDGAD